MRLLRDTSLVLRVALPAIFVLAVLDAVVVGLLAHVGWADPSRFTLLLLRDVAWNTGVLLSVALALAAGGAVSLLLLARIGLDAHRVALLIAAGLSALLGLVSLHHALEASLAASSVRLSAFAGYGLWTLCVLGVGLFSVPSGRSAARPVWTVVLVAAAPLFLGVWVDAVRVDGEGEEERTLHGTREAEGLPIADTIVLVTLDTTRFDAIGYSNSGRTRTPVLDRLAREGAAYTQATTPTPLTLPAHTSMMTGRSPWDHGVVVNGARVPTEVPVLAEMLSAAGWRTGAFVTAPVVEAETGLGRGFEVFDGVMSGSRLPAKAMATTRIMRRLGFYRYPHVRPGRVATDAALAWLEREDPRPEFLWLHLFDSHAPYEASVPPDCPHQAELAALPPGKAAEYDRSHRAPDWYAEHMHELYDREVEGMDRQLGRLVDTLDRSGRLEDSLIVVIADHGESFEAPRRFDHAATLTNETLRIPLVVRFPGVVDPGVRSRELVSVEDVYATVLEAAGFLDANASSSSMSLLVPFLRPMDATPRSFTRHETFPHPMASAGERLIATRTGRSMLVFAPESDAQAFFHLDDAEVRDRIGDTERGAELASLIEKLENGETASSTKRVADLDLIDDHETMEMLQSLGYVN
ncbi:MAG: sulfatase [bacterium]|nr:sulfatase [bacterium]